MTTYRSSGYDRIAAQVEATFGKSISRSEERSRGLAPKWRNRVGIPRIIAEDVAVEALSMLRSVNRGIFRNTPDEREAYNQAIEALERFAAAFARENYRRFKGDPAQTPEETTDVDTQP